MAARSFPWPAAPATDATSCSPPASSGGSCVTEQTQGTGNHGECRSPVVSGRRSNRNSAGDQRFKPGIVSCCTSCETCSGMPRSSRNWATSNTVCKSVDIRCPGPMGSLDGSAPSRVDWPITVPPGSPPPCSNSGARRLQWSRPPRLLRRGLRPISPQQTRRILSDNPRASQSRMNAATA